MSAVPHRAPVVKTEKKGQKLYVTVKFRRPGWQRALGADEYCERTFGLDAYGREVYDRCDGKNDVQVIANRFARKHKVSQTEAETAVTTFMKTLMSKGLVALAVDKKPIA